MLKNKRPSQGGTSGQRCDRWGGDVNLASILTFVNPLGVLAIHQRVAVYIDGFNLYYGLKSKGWSRYYWLDLPPHG